MDGPATTATLEPEAASRAAGPPSWLAVRLAVQMFLSYAVQGAWVPVFSVYLGQLGFSPTAVAWAFIAYSLSSLIAPLVWGQIADRWVPAERCISLCALVNAATLALLPYLTDPAAVFFACVLFWFFMIPVTSLGAALTLRQLAHPERSFGRIRLWGTVGWACAGWLVTCWLRTVKPGIIPFFPSELDDPGATVGAIGVTTADLADSFGIGALFAVALAVFSLTLPHTPPTPADPTVAQAVGLGRLQRLIDAPLLSLQLFRERAFFIYCVCLFGFYLTMPFPQQMTPLLLERLGVPRDALPLVMTISQSSEIAALALLPWLFRRLGSKATMLVGIGAWTVGMAAYAVGQPVALVIAAMTGHGLFICCFLVAGQVFVNRQAARDVRASAQGVIVLIGGLGLLAGHGLVGWVREMTGDDFRLAFLPAAFTSVALVVLFLTGFTDRIAADATDDSLVSSSEMT